MSDTETPVRLPIEFRAAETLEVRYPERTITVLAVPYERPTSAVVRNGRQITEVVSRGAFDRVNLQRRDVRVFRDHDKTRILGKVIKLHPEHDDGLVAELRMSPTADGNEALELAADGLLDASIGFAPNVDKRTGEVIGERYNRDRTVRRITDAYLDHVALVADPAYEDARVLDVRAAELEVAVLSHPSATPNRDTILAMLAEAGIQLRR